jgi:glycosyltransferase involved in cell wall biosynthesis
MSESKPKILVIGSLPPPYIGPSVAMNRLLKGLELNKTFKIIFLDTSDRRDLSSMGSFDWSNVRLGLLHMIQCIQLLLLKRPSIIYVGISQGTWGYVRDLAFILPALMLRCKIILHLRGSEFRTFYGSMPNVLRWITRLVMSKTSRAIVLGNNLRAVFSGFLNPARIAVIPNGIDYAQFDMNERSVDSERANNRILFLSSLMRRKGVFLLLEALPAVVKKHPGVCVTFAGTWHDENEKIEALAIIEATNLTANVRFAGQVSGSGKLDIFWNHDLFAFTPVEPEGLPWVILEAMSARLPVITTDQGAIREVVEDKHTGFIIEPTPAALSECLCHLIENPRVAKAMGDAGRRRVEKFFSEANYLSAIQNLFIEVLAE